MATWDEQWQRVRRWYDRWEMLKQLWVEQTRPIETYEDDVLAFFLNCYHLKDWLINDPASRVTAKEVEAYINRSQNLKLCTDLANGSKHLKVTRPRRDPHTKLSAYPSTYDAGRPGGGSMIVVESIYVIRAGGVTLEAFDVATGCMQEWESFLAGKRLIG